MHCRASPIIISCVTSRAMATCACHLWLRRPLARPRPTCSARVYPNPLHDHFSLAFAATTAGHLSMTLIDAAGRIVMVDEQDLTVGQADPTYDLGTGVAAGVYQARFTFGCTDLHQKGLGREGFVRGMKAGFAGGGCCTSAPVHFGNVKWSIVNRKVLGILRFNFGADSWKENYRSIGGSYAPAGPSLGSRER